MSHTKYDGMKDGRDEQATPEESTGRRGRRREVLAGTTHWIQSSLGCSINRAKENVGAVQDRKEEEEKKKGRRRRWAGGGVARDVDGFAFGLYGIYADR